MKILFMGTPDIAAQSLAALLQTQHEICGVFTREDKPVGRKQILTAPPVKQLALQHGISVYQPRTLRSSDIQQQIALLAPQLIVVVAYGRILPPEVLAIPQHGCINLHVSLLPQYRGSAPVQWAVINGDTETGVTIMQLDEGLDTGDILRVAPVIIGDNETSGELFTRISALGAETLLQTISDIENGSVCPIPQDNSRATAAPPLNKEMAAFSFAQSAATLHNLIRGCNPWPVAYFMHEGKKVKVLRTVVHTDKTGHPGQILSTKPFCIACADGALTLLEVVPEGSRPMEGSAWAAGRRFSAGDYIGKGE